MKYWHPALLCLHLLLLTLLLTPSRNAVAALPDIGEPADRSLSPQEEYALGSRFYRALHQQESILNDPELGSYLQSLGNRLSSGTGEQDFTFFVVKDPRINAFAVPGGYIGINAGLILATRNEGELASVIAHEIAHITQRHIARLYAGSGNVGWTQLGAFLAALALASQGHADGAAAAVYAGTAAGYQSLINHTRSHELEADRIGIHYLALAGFNPADMAGFFDVIRDKSLQSDQRFEILRTHPLSANRIAEAKARAARIGSQPVPSSQRYHLMKARLLSLLGQRRELLRHYQNHTGKLTASDQYAHALLLIQQARFAAARRILNRLRDGDPDNIHYPLALAQLYLNQQRPQAAAQQLEPLLQLYPNHQAGVEYYARALLQSQRHADNIQLIQDQQKQHKRLSPRLHRLLAESLNATQQTALSQLHQGKYYFLTGNYHAASLQLKAARKSEQEQLNDKQRMEIDQLLDTIEEELKLDKSGQNFH